MRVSNQYIFDTFLKYDKTRQKQISKYSNQISSGKSILAPSDDIVAVGKALKLTKNKNEIDNYLRNITIVENRQQIAESALTNITDAGQEARSEIVRLLNHGVLDQEDAEIVDKYLQDLKQYMIDQANTKVADTYIFGGTRTDQEPFDSEGKYLGNEKTEQVPVSNGYEVDATYKGSDLGIDGTKLKMIEVIDQIHQYITQDRDLSKITDALLRTFDEGLKSVSTLHSKIGSQSKMVEDFKIQHEMFKTMFNDMISKFEDADIPGAIAKLEQSKVAYEASMAVFNQNKDLSLLKYFAA